MTRGSRELLIQNRRNHAQRRAKERYEAWFSYEDLESVAQKIQAEDGVLLRRISSTKVLWLVEWKERIYKVGYSSNTKQVTTFLPLPNANNDIMLQMYDKLRRKEGT